MGRSRSEFVEGVWVRTTDFYHGATLATVIEETAEADAGLVIAKHGTAFLTNKLRRFEQASGISLFTRQNGDPGEFEVKEAFSKLVRSYFLTRADDLGQVGQDYRNLFRHVSEAGLAGEMIGYTEVFHAMARRADQIQRAREAGHLEADLETLLARSLGLDGPVGNARMSDRNIDTRTNQKENEPTTHARERSEQTTARGHSESGNLAAGPETTYSTVGRSGQSNSSNSEEGRSFLRGSEKGARRRGDFRIAKDVAETTKHTYAPGSELANVLQTLGKSNSVQFHELEPKQGAAVFVNYIAKGKAASTAGWQVFVYSADEYKGMRLFLAEDGSAGFALKPDGDLVSVFAHPDARNRPGGSPFTAMMALAIEQGAKKCDCFDGFLPNLYANFGFKPVSRQEWNQEFAPNGWRDKFGTPDVVYLIYQGGTRSSVLSRFGKFDFPLVEDLTASKSYEEAVAAQDAALEESSGGAYFSIIEEDAAFDRMNFEPESVPPDATYLSDVEVPQTLKSAGFHQIGKGRLWVNTRKGVTIFDPKTGEFSIAGTTVFTEGATVEFGDPIREYSDPPTTEDLQDNFRYITKTRIHDRTLWALDVHLDTHKTQIDGAGIKNIRLHLASRGKQATQDTANKIMLNRLDAINRGKIKATRHDLYFYTHELREQELMASFVGEPKSKFDDWTRYRLAHEKALLDYGLNPFTDAYEKIIYHPQAHRNL